MRVLFTVFVAVLFAAACGSSAKSSSTSTTLSAPSNVLWPAPPNPMELAVKAKLVPETAERLTYHVHSHLDVYVDGAPVVVPAGIGIDITDPAVHTFNETEGTAYGGIDPPCDKPCISPLHTHDVTGTLHTESATRKNNTLGQFFTEWDVQLDQKCVDTFCRPATPIAIYVNGTKFTGDPRTIALSNFEEIAIVIGKPPAKIPQSWNPAAQ
jgi:hypothetical protein